MTKGSLQKRRMKGGLEDGEEEAWEDRSMTKRARAAKKQSSWACGRNTGRGGRSWGRI